MVFPALILLAGVHCALLLPSLTRHDWQRQQRRRTRLARREADAAAVATGGAVTTAGARVGSLRPLPPAPRCSLLRSVCRALRCLLLSALRLLFCYVAPLLLLLAGTLPRRVLDRGVSDGLSMVLHALPLLREQVWQAAANAAAASASQGSAAAAAACSLATNAAPCSRRQSRWSWKAFRVALGLDASPCASSTSLAPASLMQRWQAAARECERSWEQEVRQRLMLQAVASSLLSDDPLSSRSSSSSSLLSLVGGMTKVDEGDETQSDVDADEEDRAAVLENDEDTPCCFELAGGCFVQPTPTMLRICPVTFPLSSTAAPASLDQEFISSSTAAEQHDRNVTWACKEIERQIVRPAAAAVASPAADAAPSSYASASNPLSFEFFFSPQVGVNCSNASRSSSGSVDSSQGSTAAPSAGSVASSSSVPASSVPFSTFDQSAVESILRGSRLRRVQCYECEGAVVSVHFGFQLPSATAAAAAATPAGAAASASDRVGLASDSAADSDRNSSSAQAQQRPLIHWSPPLPALDPSDRRVLDFSVFDLAEQETIQIVEMHRTAPVAAPAAAGDGEGKATVAVAEGMWLSLYTDAERRCDLGRPRGRSPAAASPSPSSSSSLGLFQAPSGSCLLGIQGLLSGCGAGLAQLQLVFGSRVDRQGNGGDTLLEQGLRREVPLLRRRPKSTQPQQPHTSSNGTHRDRKHNRTAVLAPAAHDDDEDALLDSVFDVGCIPLTHQDKQQQAVEFITASIRTSPSPSPVAVASSS